MLRNLTTAILLIITCQLALPWSQKGHDVTAYIAEQHLTPTTRAAVDSIFDGRSLVYWANWLDNASYSPAYAYTKTWHYINIDEGQTYETAPRNPNGDAVTAIRYCIASLCDSTASAADRELALKILVHVTGDLHQPMHTGHASDSGGNKVKVKYFGSERNLHSVWDGQIPESAHKWSYTEWQQQLDRLPEYKEEAIIAGNIDDWARQSVSISSDIYRLTPSGKNLYYDEVAYWTPVVEQQFLNGGLRLAHLLNLIFDPAYATGISATDM